MFGKLISLFVLGALVFVSAVAKGDCRQFYENRPEIVTRIAETDPRVSASIVYFTVKTGVEKMELPGDLVFYKNEVTGVWAIVSPTGVGHEKLLENIPADATVLGGTRYTKILSGFSWWPSSIIKDGVWADPVAEQSSHFVFTELH